MLEEELKNIWRNSSEATKIQFDISRLMIDLEHKLKRTQRQVKQRDFSEIAASVVGIPLFLFFAYEIPFVLTKVASMLSVLWFVYVIVRFRNSKKQAVKINMASSFREQLDYHRNFLAHQMHLLNTILYWYVLPPFLCNLLFIVGIGDPAAYQWNPLLIKLVPVTVASKITMLMGLLIFYSFVVWINKRAVQRNFKPMWQEVNEVIERLDKEE